MAKKHSKEDVYLALVELHRQTDNAVHRVALAAASCIPLQIVDDHIKSLISDERVVRRDRGKVEPVKVYPPARALSITYLPDGCAKIELGDELLELSPRELIFLAKIMVGHVPNFGVERSVLRSGVPQLRLGFD